MLDSVATYPLPYYLVSVAVWSAALFFGKRCCENPLHHFFEALLSRPAVSIYFDERGYRDTLIVF